MNVLSLDAGEQITAAVAVSDFTAHGFCIMATTGRVKRVAWRIRQPCAPPADRDQPWMTATSWLGAPDHGKDEVILVTEKGQALRFNESKCARWDGRPPVCRHPAG